MNNSIEIQIEVNRLKALPQEGHFTCLHHASDMIEYSNNLMERVEYILDHKPKKEILLRLQNIHYVSPERYEEYKKIRDAANAEYLKTRDAAWDNYKKICNPAFAEYLKICDPAYVEYLKIRDAAFAEYENKMVTMVTWLKTWVPFTTWNGRSIFN